MGCKMAKGQRNRPNTSGNNGGEESIIKLNEEELQKLNRKELQGYCKKNGIKANAKTEELREKLLQLIRNQPNPITDENQNDIIDESSVNRSTIASSKADTIAENIAAKPAKSTKKIKFSVPGVKGKKGNKDKTTEENHQLQDKHGNKSEAGSRKRKDRARTKQHNEKEDSQDKVTELKVRKGKTTRKQLNERQGSKTSKPKGIEILEQPSSKALSSQKDGKNVFEERVEENAIRQDDGNNVNVSQVDSNNDDNGRGHVDTGDDIFNQNKDHGKEAQVTRNDNKSVDSEDYEPSPLQNVENCKEIQCHDYEVSPADSAAIVDDPTSGNEVFDCEPVCHTTSPNNVNELSSTKDVEVNDQSNSESDARDNYKDDTDLSRVVSRQADDNVEPPFQDNSNDDNFDQVCYHDNTSDDNSKTSENTIDGYVHTAGNTVTTFDDDSICDEIISDDALNNSFGLNRTFDVKPSELTPCMRRPRNATFIIQRGMAEKEIMHCDSTSITDDDTSNVTKSSTLCSRWCVVDGMVKNDLEASWKLIKLKGGRPVVPNRFGKYIHFTLEPSQRDVPTDYRDNYICGSCAEQNEKTLVIRRDITKKRTNSSDSTGHACSEIPLTDKETSSTPIAKSFVRNTEIRGSVKRKRGDDGERHCREEQEIHRTKRLKKSSLLTSNKNPASPTVRKARGEALELPKNHKNPWRPKVPSRSSTPVNVTEDATYAEKVEAIIQNTIPGSEEELRLMMSRNCLVQRSPTKKHFN